LEVAFFTLVDLVYLNVCTISLKAFICVSTDVSYLLFSERSQLCWSHDHLPVAMLSLLVYPLLLSYPLFVYWQGRAQLEVRKRDGVTDESEMAGSLSGGSLKDEFQPLGRAYAAGFRHVIALFLSTPLEPVQLRLILPIFPLLFFGVVVKKRPFKKLVMNACKHPLSSACPCLLSRIANQQLRALNTPCRRLASACRCLLSCKSATSRLQGGP
jgi:hypothetical protein